ncbi:hypothetical protein RRG08_000955 [Elysia crispata]|uniref:Uncharacterized protein n=1 Tax=Elysia crispata TaxID=231223 RepID=A0AAE1DXL6_9GAST|nr:hypothetical protein RRG08_000955 [Elysia crispata]
MCFQLSVGRLLEFQRPRVVAILAAVLLSARLQSETISRQAARPIVVKEGVRHDNSKGENALRLISSPRHDLLWQSEKQV